MQLKSACPGTGRLEDLVMGRSSEAEVDQLAVHLRECGNCVALLPSLGKQDDLIDGLKAQKRRPVLKSAMIDDLRNRLHGMWQDTLPPDSAHTSDFSGDGTPVPFAISVPQVGEQDDVLSCLAPPQRPDEIGRLGVYRVLKVLGTGGMGVVFLAEDERLQRHVALKAMRPGLAVSNAARERFLREARLTAKLTNDHIVTIHQVDEDRGVPFLAMPLLQGETLEHRVRREGKLPTPTVLRIGREIALGLAAAHERGLIHRDIKPANIWLEAVDSSEVSGVGVVSGGVVSGGVVSGKPGTTHDSPLTPHQSLLTTHSSPARVKILDFGLARTSTQEGSLTPEGAIIGTPSYMAPEQARGEKLDPRCDLWSLGVTLYRLCTGTLPFDGNETVGIIIAVAMNEPVPPIKINPEVPAALSDLVMKLLQKEPAQRVGSAKDVVAALKEIERGQHVSTPSDTVAVSMVTKKAVPSPAAPARTSAPRRRRMPVLLAAGLLLTLIGGGILFGGQIIRVVTNQGELVVEVDDPSVEIKIVKDDVVVEDKTSKRTFTLTAGKGDIVVVEKDGVKLLTREFELTRGGKTTVKVTLKELDDARKPPVPPGSGSEITEPKLDRPLVFKHKGPVDWATISPDGRKVISYGHGEEVTRFWSLKTGKEDYVLEGDLCPGNGGWPWCPVHLKAKETLMIWDSAKDKETASFKLPNAELLWAGVAPNGRIGAYTAGGEIVLVDVESRKSMSWTKCQWTRNVAGWFSPDSRLFVFPAGKVINFLEPKEGAKVERTLKGHESDINFISRFSPDGKLLASADTGGTLKIWDVENSKEVASFARDKMPQGEFSPDGKTFVLSNYLGGPVHLWDVATKQSKEVCTNGPRGFASFSPDGHYLVLTSSDGLRIWDLAAEKVHLEFKPDQAYTAQFSPSGKLIATAGYDGTVMVWDFKAHGEEDLRKALAKIVPDDSDPDRRAAAWVLSIGGIIKIKKKGEEREIKPGGDLPKGAFELTGVDLHENPKVTDAGLANFKDCKNLTSLDLRLVGWGRPVAVSDAGLTYFKDCKNLTHLDLNTCGKVGDAGLANFKDCKKLTYLDLRYGGEVTNAGLANFRDCKNLTYLNLSGCPRLSEAGLASFKDCNNLTYLCLEGIRAGESGLANFKTCENLVHLDLDACITLSEAGLANFKDCKKVGWLNLANCNAVTDMGLANFKDCKNLEYLNLLYCSGVGDKGLANFKGCKNVTFLDLAGTQVGDPGLAGFQDCTTLTRLDLHGCGAVTDVGLNNVKDFKDLTYLDLSGTQVGNAGMAQLKEWKNLAYLSLAYTSVGDDGLAHLKMLSKMNELFLSGTQVTGAGLRNLKGMIKLGHLPLVDTRLSDADLKEILNLLLENIAVDLTRTRISLKGHNYLERGVQAKIPWSEPNREASEKLLALGGTIVIRVTGEDKDREVKAAADLPDEYFQIIRVNVSKKPMNDQLHLLGRLNDPVFDRLELEPLDLSETKLDDFDLGHLGRLTRLKELSLAGNGKVSDKGLAHLKTMKGLRRLALEGCPITGTGLDDLKDLPDLADLSISSLTDDGLVHLKSLPGLRRLVLDGCNIRGRDLDNLKELSKLTELRLGCPKLTDIFLGPVGEMKSLEKLSLTGSGVTEVTEKTEDVFKCLHGLTNLQTLDLHGIKITDQGMAALKKALPPKCEIEWDGKKDK